MILNKIKLENIRSYLTEEINFPTSSILLSGDVGSGKSTILQAIDFALFGIRRPGLLGSTLLRNGKSNGSVELHFEVEDKKIIIKRTLKRIADTVTQDSGFIMINDVKKEGTALELKESILKLLSYPKELLTKTKSLIYTYTVYTPQEEMKAILLGDRESRIDTLRKVFGIDKYKRIKENTKIFVTRIKEKKKELVGRISDLEDKRKEKEERESKIRELTSSIDLIIPPIEKYKKQILAEKESIGKIEEEISRLNQLKKEYEVNKLRLKYNDEQLQKDNNELIEVDKQIKTLELELKERNGIRVSEKDIENKENQINLTEDNFKRILIKISEFKTKKTSSENIKSSLASLETCPTCKQKVTQEYKHKIVAEESNRIQGFSNEISALIRNQEENERRLDNLKSDLNKLRNLQNNYKIFLMKSDLLEEKNNSKKSILENKAKIKQEINDFNVNKDTLLENIKKYENVEEDYKRSRLELEELQEKLKDVEIKKISLDKEKENTEEILDKLQKEIEIKLSIKEDLNYLDQLHHWLEEFFVKLMSLIEKQILLRVHMDFDTLFQKWFNIIMDVEILNVKLDDEFTPVIIQNGHEIDYLSLSGGEKTSIALAYRLALNQVINNLITTIKTKDLLILDEPTDGFSSEQLDRIKLVLDELNSKQIIIVSHENKVESFVNEVIKLSKKEHVSQIIQ